MFHPEGAEADRFELVIIQSIRRILVSSGPEDFLAWAQTRIPDLLGFSAEALDDSEHRRLAGLLGMAIWNAAPTPANGFQPAPLHQLADDAPCPCGSGRRYRDCCAALEELPELSTELIWEFLLDELSDNQLREALRLDAVPKPLLARVADRWLEEDRPRRAVALLEPLFAGSLIELDARYEPALDLLCDAYDRLDHWRKKRAFLQRLCDSDNRVLSAVAWQRRSAMAIDEGDFEQATAAFNEALRNGPDSPGTALLEITLLATQHRDQLARERARFWLHRLRRLGNVEPEFLDFLAQAVEDPQAALVDTHADSLDPDLVDLNDWVAVATARPLPRLVAVPARDHPPEIPVGQLGLFEDGATDHAPTVEDIEPVWSSPAQLRAPAALRRVESRWRARFPSDKPVSIQLAPQDAVAVWGDTSWLDHLLGHPELADSLEVLDDLATALYAHPESTLPWMEHALLRPLLERAWTMINNAAPADGPYHLPWSITANRPALRLVFRRYLCLSAEGEQTAATTTLETLLRLNPQDNHGIRAELMNHYLRAGLDERALALAARFPDDLLADLAYGEVLALYRLGEQERARQALGRAMHRLPRIPHYLTRKRIKRPQLDPYGITPGGEDQAWLYREAMRDVWVAEPGVLAWLKRLTA
ncbi:SEC-C metal-binding domain-containing protein [Marichromatium bheemlicum]|uniref:SEC-C domain-containing protein n=1 Tax=Marichromatium bheemlicum TaxID=365339 RepID=A0ABX1IBD3_9GAMM|nr:SEC-C metal-binding domain-containing protein [Marichromatium bheemlicum]NKN34578.1 SEC-C domain-containing protein [Marichromatium bheemlicum]